MDLDKIRKHLTQKELKLFTHMVMILFMPVTVYSHLKTFMAILNF